MWQFLQKKCGFPCILWHCGYHPETRYQPYLFVFKNLGYYLILSYLFNLSLFCSIFHQFSLFFIIFHYFSLFSSFLSIFLYFSLNSSNVLIFSQMFSIFLFLSLFSSIFLYFPIFFTTLSEKKSSMTEILEFYYIIRICLKELIACCNL